MYRFCCKQEASSLADYYKKCKSDYDNCHSIVTLGNYDEEYVIKNCCA